MRAVILAAGIGSRLYSSNDLPKCLTRLSNGQTILERQLNALKGIDVTVIVGFHKEKICEAFPKLKTIYSPHFAEQNTAKSLLLSLEEKGEDLLWVNGDVVFNPAIISRLDDKTCMVVNRGEVGIEEVKYTLDKAGLINQVSKDIKDGIGEAVGINFFKAQDLFLLEEGLKACQERDYFEKGIEYVIQKGVKVAPLEIQVEESIEIDFLEDLIRANQCINFFN